MSSEEIKQSLRQIVEEVAELKAVAGGALTDVMADWLAPQYAAAAREQLASAATSAARWKVLRMVATDLSALRHGDHTAERLQIERERLKLAKRDAKEKQRTKMEAGLDAVTEEIKNNPKAKALFKPLHELLSAESRPRREKEFREWIQRPEVRKEIFPELTRGLSPETLRKIEDELRLL